MSDAETGDLDDLLRTLVGKAMENVMARPAEDWSQVIADWDEYTTAEIIRIVEQLDGDPLRSLAAQLLHRATEEMRTELLTEAFPLLGISEN
jgi:hypothetical protein